MTATEPAPLIESIAAGKTYRRGLSGAIEALVDFTLAVGPGESVVLLGRNGAGKSTALRLLAGMERPTRGVVRAAGLAPRDSRVSRRIGYLADGAEMLPFLDARETLHFFAAISGLDRAEARRRVDRLIERFGLSRYAARRAARYSTGMRRRLALAAVLLPNPDILLLDEPSSGLDAEGERLFVEAMIETKARGAAVVVASHHLAHLESFADRCVILRSGTSVFSGGAEDLIARRSTYDATLSGLSPEGRRAVRSAVEGLGGRIAHERPAERDLEDILGEAGGSRDER